MSELKLDGLQKKYASNLALDNFTYSFQPGIYGLLGPNGAGKSTLMNIIVGNLAYDAGTIYFDGVPVRKPTREYRRLIGYVPQQQSMYPQFTVQNFLYYMALLKAVPKQNIAAAVDECLSLVNLAEKRKERIRNLSGGMKQRVLIAQAVLGNPEIIVLDEPTAGVDPMERIRIRNMISRIAINKIVLIATHIVTDIECIANQVIVMNRGKIIASDTPAHLSESMKKQVVEITLQYSELENFIKEYRVSNIHQEENGIVARVILKNNQQLMTDRENFQVHPSLDDVYLYYFEEENMY